MIELKNLFYVSDAVLSDFRANAIHVMKMCNAFSSFYDKVTLYCKEWNHSDDVYKEYGVPQTFDIKCKSNRYSHWMPPTIQLILSGYANAQDINKNEKGNYVYGRSIWTLFFLNKKTRFSYEVHSTPNKALYRFLESRILKRSSIVSLVCISQPLVEVYKGQYPTIPTSKFMLLHDGADSVPADTEKASLSACDKSDIHVGYIGSLYPGKCMETLMPIAKAMPETFFHIVGGNKEYVSQWRVDCLKRGINNIEFYGKIQPCLVNNYYQAFDIVLLPYSEDVFIGRDKKYNIGKWISPLKLFEAMSNAKPVVVTSLKSINDVLENGKDAIIVKADDVDGWVKAINALKVDAGLRRSLGQSALQKFETQYSWKKRAERIIKQYEASI